MSGTGITLAAAAAMDGVPSVQALRKRIKKGTLRSVRVMHRDSIVVGIELGELARHYAVKVATPQGTPRRDTEEPPTPTEQPAPPHSQPDNHPEDPVRASRAQQEEEPVACEEQPESATTEQPGPTEPQGLQTVDMAVQGWREAREALEIGRREHREEVTRTVASYEAQLRAREQERQQIVEVHEAREVRALRWGRGASIALIAALVLGVRLTEDASDRLGDERVRAGILTEQNRVFAEEGDALRSDLQDRSLQLEAAATALEQAQTRTGAVTAEREELELQLRALEAEQERAREATRAALRAMGAR